MVKTRKKHNNRKKRNTQRKKRRSTQKKRRSMRRKLIMKKMFGGETYKAYLVGSGSVKKVYRYNTTPHVQDKLLVEIEILKQEGYYNADVSEAILEYMLLEQLYNQDLDISAPLNVVKVEDLNKSEYNSEKTIISYIIEECGLNLSKNNEKKIFVDLLLSPSVDDKIKKDKIKEDEIKEDEIKEDEIKEDEIKEFFDQIINCSIFNLKQPLYSGIEGTKLLKKGLYLNLDCKPENFCYQKTDSGTIVKVMDVGIEHLLPIHPSKFELAKLYVFILYCGIIVKYYDTNDDNKNEICEKMKTLSLKLFDSHSNIQRLLSSVGSINGMMSVLVHYLLNVPKIVEGKDNHRHFELVNQGVKGYEMKHFLLQFMAPEFFPEVVRRRRDSIVNESLPFLPHISSSK
jgi:hypothetical protein